MPRKKRSKEDKGQIDAALDEIEAAQAHLAKKRISKTQKKNCGVWIRQKKALLKELGYRGKMPRQTRAVNQVVYDDTKPKKEEVDECLPISTSASVRGSRKSRTTGTSIASSATKRTRRRRSKPGSAGSTS